MNQEQLANSCPICGGIRQVYLFEIHGYSVTSCTECGFTVSSPAANSRNNDRFSIGYASGDTPRTLPLDKTQIEASKRYLRMLGGRSTNIHNILLVAEPEHCFASLAKDSGYSVLRHLSVDELQKEPALPQAVDAVVIIYQLEKADAVEKILARIHQALRPEGELFIIALSLDSSPARFFGQSWIGWRPENRYYFDNTTIQSLLWKSGFNEIQLSKDLRWYTLSHIYSRAQQFPKTWITRAVRAVYSILPSGLRNLYFRMPTSGVVVTAKRTERRQRPVVSIILPIYNEGSTFSALMDQLVGKQINNADKEIIVVESNSSDNSRQLVMSYTDYPDIKIILQEKARGKGNAVREGLDHATGDIIIIQDADLEYDLNDYEALLEPVAAYRRPFVLGSRHGGKWKMRHFTDQTSLSTYFNFGHVLFTALLNLLYGQHMKDPFTMFKVFRRDCLYNLKFECNRFDFDFELVIKLLRKGYTPLEIPVNYYSRSFKEGKKVRMFRDPLTWLRATFKYRFVSIYAKPNSQSYETEKLA